MPHDPKFWERMLPMIRSADPDELAHRLRHVLGADPFRLTPRHWLAEVYRSRNQLARAIGEYERLLPLAVGAGDLFRAIAVQKRLEELDPRPGSAERYAAIHRWFRMLGVTRLVNAPSTNAAGLSARALIRLPREGFIRAAAESGLETYGHTSRQLEIEGAEQHVVLWGELVWDVKLADGRRRREQAVVEGDLMRIDPEFAGPGLMRVRPDTPAECLRFGTKLLADLVGMDASIVNRSTIDSGEIVREERSLLLSKPAKREDLDHQVQPPASGAPDGPRRLELGGSSPPPVPKTGDIESWIGYQMLTLDSKPLDLSVAGTGSITEGLRMFDLDTLPQVSSSAAESDELTLEDLDRASVPPVDSTDVPILDLDGARPSPGRGLPAGPPSGPRELGDGRVPPGQDPFLEPAAAPGPDEPAPTEPTPTAGTPAERRSEPRIALEVGGRVRLMGLAGGPHAAMECRVFDLSQGGVGVVFPREDIHSVIAILEGEILNVELDVPGSEPLKVAARMRWVDPGKSGMVLAGLQFVLLAPTDRDVVTRIVGQSARSPR
ncbi:MAG: PilZ domain-containing protein [Candidatus Eisenbacteria bacterium]